MERALSGSQYVPTIVRFRKNREGNKAFWALVAQNAGKPVWEKRIKDAESYMMNHKWTGTRHQTTEKDIDFHRSAFVCLSEATNHVSHQIPNKCTLVGYLVGSIDSKDADILSALEAIRQDDTGMRENFELAAIFLASTCPVTKKQGNNKVAFDTTISETYGEQSGRGKTGVELHYHKKHGFLDLQQDQKDELVAYKATKDGGKWKGAAGKPGSADGKRNGKGKGPSPNKKLKPMISSIIEDATNKKEQLSTQDEIV